MAISDPVALTSAGVTTDSTTYDAPVTGALSVDDIIICITHLVDSAAIGSATFSNNGGTGTFSFTNTAVGSLDGNSAAVETTDTSIYRVQIGWARCTSAGTLILRATLAGTQQGGAVTAMPLRGTHLTDPVRGVITNSGAASRPTYTLANAPRTGSWMVSADNIRRNPPAWTVEAGGAWLEDVDAGQATPVHGWYVAHRESEDQSTTYSAGTNGTWRGLMIEVQEPAAAVAAFRGLPILGVG